jgi:Na+/proline symporter
VGGAVLAAIFAAGIVGTMLSTADALLMGSILVFVYDIGPQLRRGIRSDESLVSTGRRATGAFVLIAIGLVWLQTLTSLPVLPILLGAYGAQLSIFPSVFGP